MKKTRLVVIALLTLLVSGVTSMLVNNIYKCRKFHEKFNDLEIGDSIEDVRKKMNAIEAGSVFLNNERIYYFESPCYISTRITLSGTHDFENATEPPDLYGYVQVFLSDQNLVSGYRMIGESPLIGSRQ